MNFGYLARVRMDLGEFCCLSCNSVVHANTIFWSCILFSMWENFRGRTGPAHFRGSTAWAALELWCRAELEGLRQGCFRDSIAVCPSVEAVRTWERVPDCSEAALATGPDQLTVGSCACPQRPPACFFPFLQAFFLFFPLLLGSVSISQC